MTQEKSACFGVLWLGPNTSPCSRCLVEDECGQEFVKKRLLPMKERLGSRATLKTLAKALVQPEDSILLGLALAKNILPAEEPKREPVVETKPEKEPKDRQWEWDSKYDKARWYRERERSPLVKALKPGMQISTMVKGQTYELTVCDDGYEFRGNKYPTLYAVTKAAIGVKTYESKDSDGKLIQKRRLMGYSGIRFWKLEKFLKDK